MAEHPQMAPAPQPLRVSTSLVDAVIVTCGLPRSGPTAAHYVRRTWIGLPLSGLFRIDARGDEHLVHPSIGVVFPEGLDYRMAHPVDGGDTDIALMFREDVVQEALPDRMERVQVTGLELGTRWAVGRLVAAMRHGDNAQVEEIGLALLRGVVAHLAPGAPDSLSSVARERIGRVRILMAERPDLPWTVGALARVAAFTIDGIGKLFDRISAKAGVRFSVHILRHTWATNCRLNGMDLLTLKEQGGWTRWEMVERYAHIVPLKDRTVLPDSTAPARKTGRPRKLDREVRP